ncbi:MAG: glycosyltransferase family 2 protein, partial [Cellulomonas iranensis]|nr:glycosyltransferase family 2 protein [Cellulomonas iranensis]
MTSPETWSGVPRVSVVVPVYGVERYLRKCLDSLLAQTLDGLEIVTVNDASPDGSLAILREYEAAHPGRVI